MSIIYQNFSAPLLSWYPQHGRHDLPWQHPRSPYSVWVSEIMLQQTQVNTVIPYFQRFMQQFPNLDVLAIAHEQEVLALWSGLGYYSRARNLHQTARILYREFAGEFPKDVQQWMRLPGIGQSTAAAITSQAFNLPTAILDGNVKRILSRYFMVAGYPEKASVKQELWNLATQCMPLTQCRDYTQAIMDLGATCCTTKNPNCAQCPLSPHCRAFQQGCVNEYPHKKIKKPRPTRHQQFLVFYNNQHQVYLEKRPEKGLWGGLWCLPNIETDECPISVGAERFNLTTTDKTHLLHLKHTFSHFHLHIEAYTLQVVETPLKPEEANDESAWVSPADLPSLGLAKPTKVILESFFLGRSA